MKLVCKDADAECLIELEAKLRERGWVTLMGDKRLIKSNLAVKFKKTLNIASGIAEDVMKLRDKPKMSDYISIGTRLAHKVASSFEKEIYNYFDEWHDIADLDFSDDVIRVLLNAETEQVGGLDSYRIMVTTLNGEKFGWVQTTHEGKKNAESKSGMLGPWILPERYDESFAALGRAMWEHNACSKLCLRSFQNRRYDKNDTHVTIEPDREIYDGAHPSKKGDEIYDWIRKFYDRGKNRSLILLGPPGSGKTTIMKYIAKKFDKHTLRVSINDLSRVSSSTGLVAAVQLLKPEILLVDDFDRFAAKNAEGLLSDLEHVNKNVRVFIISANDISHLDPAIIRAGGRFDEICEITYSDNQVIGKLIPDDVPESIRTRILTWPVAYIHEFAQRCEVLGTRDAILELPKLQHRVENINNSGYMGISSSYRKSNVEVDDKSDDPYDEIEELLTKMESGLLSDEEMQDALDVIFSR